MNGPPSNETPALLEWLRDTFRLITNDIHSGKAQAEDLRRAMGFIEALRIDTRSEVQTKARAIDAICVRELARRRETTHRNWLEQLQGAVAELADSSTDVAAAIDDEILEDLRSEARDLRRHWSIRIFRRMCRQLRRISP